MRPPVNFCQVCGHAMTDKFVFGRTHRACPACGFIHFEDPKVAAVAFVVENSKVLLVRRAFNPERGKWALPAGYVDYGEDPRAAVVREVREETGLAIEVTRLLDVLGEPGTFGASIVIIYEARVTGGTAAPDDDADEIMWFSAAAPLPDLAFASTRSMLQAWIAARYPGDQSG